MWKKFNPKLWTINWTSEVVFNTYAVYISISVSVLSCRHFMFGCPQRAGCKLVGGSQYVAQIICSLNHLRMYSLWSHLELMHWVHLEGDDCEALWVCDKPGSVRKYDVCMLVVAINTTGTCVAHSLWHSRMLQAAPHVFLKIFLSISPSPNPFVSLLHPFQTFHAFYVKLRLLLALFSNANKLCLASSHSSASSALSPYSHRLLMES